MILPPAKRASQSLRSQHGKGASTVRPSPTAHGKPSTSVLIKISSMGAAKTTGSLRRQVQRHARNSRSTSSGNRISSGGCTAGTCRAAPRLANSQRRRARLGPQPSGTQESGGQRDSHNSLQRFSKPCIIPAIETRALAANAPTLSRPLCSEDSASCWHLVETASAGTDASAPRSP